MKSFLILLAFLQLFSIVAGELGCNNTASGKYSSVICVSKTQFVFPREEFETAESFSCTNGTVCADVLKICSSSEKPVCNNTHRHSPGTCNECIDEVTNRVCISNTTYSICYKGVVQTNLNYTCPPSTPYCKAEFNTALNETLVMGICTANPVKLDCNIPGTYVVAPTVPPTVPPTIPPTLPPCQQTFTCTQPGFFADPKSNDCSSYIKCQPRLEYDQLIFACPTAGTKFNPFTQRCEANCNCP